MKNSYIKVFSDWAEQTKYLTDEEFGSLIRCLLDYAAGECRYEPAGCAKYLIPVYKHLIDYDFERYEEIVNKRSLAGKKGAEKRWAKNGKIANDSQNSQEQEKEKD